jgi:hypothetical protein
MTPLLEANEWSEYIDGMILSVRYSFLIANDEKEPNYIE